MLLYPKTTSASVSLQLAQEQAFPKNPILKLVRVRQHLDFLSLIEAKRESQNHAKSAEEKNKNPKTALFVLLSPKLLMAMF